jgi:hypothetical protein
VYEVEFLLTIDGQRHRVTAVPYDLLVWERTAKGKRIGDLLPVAPNGSLDFTRLSLVEIYRLAHIAARREQVFTGPLDEFERTVVVTLSDAGSPGPTPPARSDEPVSSSRSRPASHQTSGPDKARRQSSPQST